MARQLVATCSPFCKIRLLITNSNASRHTHLQSWSSVARLHGTQRSFNCGIRHLSGLYGDLRTSSYAWFYANQSASVDKITINQPTYGSGAVGGDDASSDGTLMTQLSCGQTCGTPLEDILISHLIMNTHFWSFLAHAASLHLSLGAINKSIFLTPSNHSPIPPLGQVHPSICTLFLSLFLENAERSKPPQTAIRLPFWGPPLQGGLQGFD